MSNLILTRGIPGSGKSTWAKEWVQQDPDNRVRVNRDELRRMLFGATETKLPWNLEVQVTAAERAIATTALDKGKSVVVDATNLRARFVKQWFTLGHDVEFRDFEVTLEVALSRNALRGKPVPDEVIEKFWRDCTIAGALPEPPVNAGNTVEKYEPNMELPSAFIFDIDGTIAHMREGGRSPYDYTRVIEDEPDLAVIDLLNELGVNNYIILMSGREDSCRDKTAEWLADHFVHYDQLHMRASGDTRRDSTVKLELFDQHVRGRYNVRGVIDDRNQVVKMWRDLGLKCYQAQEGAF